MQIGCSGLGFDLVRWLVASLCWRLLCTVGCSWLVVGCYDVDDVGGCCLAVVCIDVGRYLYVPRGTIYYELRMQDRDF